MTERTVLCTGINSEKTEVALSEVPNLKFYNQVDSAELIQMALEK